MSVLNICTYPNTILIKKSNLVNTIDKNILSLIEDMYESMYNAEGVGLAAPQVGINLKIMVVDGSLKDQNEPLILINPQIISMEGELFEEEGCLSIPEIKAKVKRANRVKIGGLDFQGRPIVFDEEGVLARVFQHEMDHLEGVLFWDRLEKEQQNLLKAKYKK